MSKRVRKVIGVMLVVLASCFCGLTGCKGKYDDMTLELSTKSIELILDEQEDENGDTKYLGEGEFTASVGGVGSDVSREVFASISSSDVLNVVNLGVDEDGVTKFKLTANSTIKDPVKLTVRTKEGGKTASLDVTATRPLKNISYNNSYSPNAFVVVGQEKIIDSNQAILFEPAETNQKNITYTISQANGHEAKIENGKLLVTKKSSTSSTIVVTASSDQNGIDPVDIELKVVEPVSLENIVVTSQDGTKIDSQYIWSVSNLLTAQTKLKVQVDTLEDIQISASVLFSDQQIFTCSSEVNLANEITLNTLGYTGTNTLRISVKIQGYDYTTTKDIQIKVEKLPSQILVNNEDISKLAYKEYDIYSSYKNNLGQKFDISVGDQFASDKRFTLFVSEEERKYIKVVYSDGQEIDLSGNTVLSSGTSIYVIYAQTDDANPDVTPNLVIRTLGGNEFQHLEANLKFVLRISAKDISVKAYGERENILYVEQNKEVYVSYTLNPNGAYAKGITCEGYDKSLIDVDIDYSEELPLIKIKAKNVSGNLQTSFRLKLPNGYESETIYVYPYVEAQKVNLTAPKITEEYGQSIADAKYDAGNLESLVIAKGGYTKLNVVALNQNSVATVYGQTFALVDETDRNFLKINDEGYITARGVKKEDGSIKIKATIKTLAPVLDENENCLGDATVVEHEIEFSVTVFVQISSISLDKQFADLYFRNNVWYENGVLSAINKLSVNLSMYPSNAVADKIEWQLSNSDDLYISTSDDGKLCNIVADEILAGQSSDTRNLTLTVFVTQQNKVFSRTVYITLKRVYIPTNVVIDGVKHSSNGKVESVLNNELYLDVRELNDNTFIQFVSHVTGTNSAIKPTNSKVGYKVESGSSIIAVDNNGNLTFKKDDNGKYQSGVCEITVYAQGSIYDNYGDPKVKQTIKITIADGKSIETAYKIQNKQDFENMFKDAEIENHYYKIVNDIYLGSFSLNHEEERTKAPRYLSGGNHTIYGTFPNAIFGIVNKNCVIENLNINASVENNDVSSGFAILTWSNLGIIKNVNISLQKFNLKLSSSVDYAETITIGTIAAVNTGTITDCSVQGDINIDGNKRNPHFIFGGLVGTNAGTISSNNKNFEAKNDSNETITNFSGKISISNLLYTNKYGTIMLSNYIGAVCGFNYNKLQGLRVDNAQIIAQGLRIENNQEIASGLNNVGGLVGYSTAERLEDGGSIFPTISDNYVNCIVKGNSNVGGLAGFILLGTISNNIVEFYETDEIYQNTNSKFFVIQGEENVGGLVGEAQNSIIKNNYVRNYAEKIYIKGTTNVGGLIGAVGNSNVTSCFAYVNMQGTTNVGGLIGSTDVVADGDDRVYTSEISNTYSRGKIDDSENITNVGELIGYWIKDQTATLTNSYSTILLSNVTANDDANNVYYNKTASELATIFGSEIFKDIWKIDASYNDGYPILICNENNMEKFIATELNVEIKESYKDNERILVKVTENLISLSDIVSITNQIGGEVSLNDLILNSTNLEVFEINNKNQIVFKSYGKAKLSVAYKYNRSLNKEIDIVFVHDVKDFGLKDQNLDNLNKLNVRTNSNTLLYTFANDSNGSLTANNLFIKVQIAKVDAQVSDKDAFRFNGYEFETMEIDGNEYYVAYLPLGSIVLQTLQKLESQLTLSVVEKIDNEYIELTSKQNLTLNIFNGITSISIDKESVNLTTINEIEFTVTIIADIENIEDLEFNVTELDNQNHIKLDNNSSNYDLILICAENENNPLKNQDGTFTHTLRYVLRMRDEYLLLNSEKGNERLELKEGFATTLKFDSSLSDSLSKTLNITVEPQDLLKIDVVHFPNGQETRTSVDDTSLYEPNELPSNTITPGEFGLLMIDVYPEYAYYDEIEVYYEANNSSKMTFVQAAFANINNSTSQKFVEVKPSALFYNEKIILSRISQVEMENGSLTKTLFTGRLYVKTLISSSTIAGTRYTIKVKATRYDSDGNVESVLESKPLVIESLPRPSVLITSDADDIQTDDNGAIVYIARGTSQTVTATTTNYTKYADFAMQFKNLHFVHEDDEFKDLTLDKEEPRLEQSGNSATIFIPLVVKAGTEITVSATVSRFINGIEYPSVSSIKFIVVDYIITGLKTDQVNNSMNIPSGQTKFVSLELITKNATEQNSSEYIGYNNILTSYNNQLRAYESLIETEEIKKQKEEIEAQIEYYEGFLENLEMLLNKIDEKIQLDNETISTLSNNTWKWAENGSTVDLSTKFEATDNNNSTSPFYYISLRNNIGDESSSFLKIEGKATRDEPLTYISAEFNFKYESGQIKFLFTEDNTETTKKYVACGLEIYIVTSATIDKPTPISTIEQFFGMNDEDYILMNDLYLTTQDAYFTRPYSQESVENNTGNYNFYYYDENTRFTSIVPKFKSFDGNGNKIYINSFALSTDIGENFGFFTEIKENVMVRNLEIVFLNQVIETETETDGIKKIERNATNEYVISADGLTNFNFGLFAGENSGIITNCNVTYANIFIENNNLQLDENKSNQFTVKIDNNEQAVVGGFVGVNNGYITNSKIGGVDFEKDSYSRQSKVLNIKANGTVGGFVGQNNYRISSCYAYNVGVENTSTNLKDSLTAGFVASNSNNGIIIESFSEGGITLNEKEMSYEVKNMQNFVSSMGNVGGFVHTNNGQIKDSYSNLPIKTPSRSAGFVYINSGDTAIISECYSRAVSIDQTDTSAFRYFTGTDNKSKVNNLDGATITHCFYMLDQAPAELDKDFKEPANNISQSNFASANYFYGFDTNIWSFGGTRPTLSRTTQVTRSNRFISGTEVTDGVTTGYSYSYSSDTPLGKPINPIIIYDADSFLRALNADEFKNFSAKTYNYNFGNIRLVCDIDFEAQRGSDELKKLQNVVFAGQLNGNGFTLQNIAILGNESEDMFGLFKQVGTDKNKEKAEILNITLNVTEIAKANSKMVGVLAGKIINSSIVNTNIHGEDVALEGQNLVGGLAGYIGKDTNLSGVTSNVSVTSAYSNFNDNSKYRDTVEGYESKSDVRYSQNTNDYSKLSYAGGIAGIIDLNPNIITTKDNGNISFTDNDTNTVDFFTISRLRVQGSVTISGEIVGGIAGYLARGSQIEDAKLVLDSNMHLIGKFASGGLVGENYGVIKTSRVEVDDEYFEEIDKEYTNNTTLELFENENTMPKYVGGLVGVMPVGGIINSFSKANVVHHNAEYIGGIAGSIGQTVDNEYIKALQEILKDELKKLSIDKYLMLIGTVVDKVYTTGLVYTNPNYIYSYNDGTKDITTSDSSVITNGTIEGTIYATPRNHVGGLYGKAVVQMYAELPNANVKEELLNKIFQNIVGINNWRDNISGYGDSIRFTMNGGDRDRKDENDEAIKDSKTSYTGHTGYLAGEIKFVDADSFIDKQNSLTGNFYLNNFIGSAQKTTGNNKINDHIKNQFVTVDGLSVDKTSLFKFAYNYLHNDKIEGENLTKESEEVDYDNIYTNLRYEYRDNQNKSVIYYDSFDPEIWDKSTYTYPRLFDNQSERIVVIRTEDDLFGMANTTGVATTYYLANDIVLTRNWKPIKGFRGKFLSAEGGPYTIYNININTNTESNVAFFATAEDAQIININFVFGGKLAPEIDAENKYVYKTDEDGKSTGEIVFSGNDFAEWNTINGLYPFTTGGEDAGKQNFAETTFNDYKNGGISATFQNVNENSTNTGALIASSAEITLLSVGIKFAKDSHVKVDYKESNHANENSFGLIVSSISVENSKIALINNVSVDLSQLEANNDTNLSSTLGIEFNFANKEQQTFNYGALIGQINNNSNQQDRVSVKSINNSLSTKTTINEITLTNESDSQNNSAINVGGVIGYVDKAQISNIFINVASDEDILENQITLNSGNSEIVNVGGFVGKVNNASSFINLQNERKVNITLFNTISADKLNDSSVQLNAGGFVGFANALTMIDNTQNNFVVNSSIELGVKDTSYNANKTMVGGLVGYSQSSNFSGLGINSTITVKNTTTNVFMLGGAVGLSTTQSTFENCLTAGDIIVEKENNSEKAKFYIGGFAGLIGTELQNQVETKNASKNGSKSISQYLTAQTNIQVSSDLVINGNIGGFVGCLNENTADIQCSISMGYIDCKLANVLDNAHAIGGFVGYHGQGGINKSVSLCTIFAKNTISSGSNNIGGFVGYLTSGYDSCYYAYELSGVQDNYMSISSNKNYGNKLYANATNSTGVVYSTPTKDDLITVILNSEKNKFSSLLKEEGTKFNPIRIDADNYQTLKFEDNKAYILTQDIQLDGSEEITKTVGKNTVVLNGFDASSYDNASVGNFVITINNTARPLFDEIGEHSLVSGVIVEYSNITNIQLQESEVLSRVNSDLEGKQYSGFAGLTLTNNGSIFACSVKGEIKIPANWTNENENKGPCITSIAGDNKGTISGTNSSLVLDFNGFGKGISNINISAFTFTNNGYIFYSYANGQIKNVENFDKTNSISGFMLYNNQTVENCYSAVACVNTNASISGFMKRRITNNKLDVGNITNCYYDNYAFANLTEEDDAASVKILSTDKFMNPATYSQYSNSTDSGKIGLDFSKTTIWTFDDTYNYGYPIFFKYAIDKNNNDKTVVQEMTKHLLRSVQNTGDGTSENPYQIHHAGRLDWIRTLYLTKETYFVQTNDIDMSSFGENGFVTIGGNGYDSEIFNGYSSNLTLSYMIYNGKEHIINNIKMVEKEADIRYIETKTFALFETAKKIENLGVKSEIKLFNKAPNRIAGLVGTISVESEVVSPTIWENTKLKINNCFADVKFYLENINANIGGLAATIPTTRVQINSSSSGTAGSRIDDYDGYVTNCFTTGIIENNTQLSAIRHIGGISGDGGYFDKSNYSSVILKTINNTFPITYRSTSSDSPSSSAYFDYNISLCGTKTSPSSISFVDDWMLNLISSNGKLVPNNSTLALNGDWTYSKTNYPVQTWVTNSTYAKKILDYDDKNSEKGIGSHISPYQISTELDITKLSENNSSCTNFVLLNNIAINSSNSNAPINLNSSIYIKSGVTLNGNGKTITIDSNNISAFSNLTNAIISGLTIDNVYNHIYKEKYNILSHNNEESKQCAILTNNVESSVLFNLSVKTKKAEAIGKSGDEEFYPPVDVITISSGLFAETVSDSVLKNISFDFQYCNASKDLTILKIYTQLQFQGESNSLFIGSLENSGIYSCNVTANRLSSITLLSKSAKNSNFGILAGSAKNSKIDSCNVTTSTTSITIKKDKDSKITTINASLFVGSSVNCSISSCQVETSNSTNLTTTKITLGGINNNTFAESRFGLLVGSAKNSTISNVKEFGQNVGKIEIDTYASKNNIGALAGYLYSCVLLDISIGKEQQKCSSIWSSLFQENQYENYKYQYIRKPLEFNGEFTYNINAELDVHLYAESENNIGGLVGYAETSSAENLKVSNNVYAIAEKENIKIYLGGVFGSIDSSTLNSCKKIIRNIGNVKGIGKQQSNVDKVYYGTKNVFLNKEEGNALKAQSYFNASNHQNTGWNFPYVGGFAGKVGNQEFNFSSKYYETIECYIPILDQNENIISNYNEEMTKGDAYGLLSYTVLNRFGTELIHFSSKNSSDAYGANKIDSKYGVYSGVYTDDGYYCGTIINSAASDQRGYISYCFGNSFIPYVYEY